MYCQTGAGKAPVPPGLMAMATLLQGDLRASDATMVELTVFDLRVQIVLDCLGHRAPAFSQGALSEFRQRLISTQMDRRLLERTVEVAARQREFDWRQLKATLKVAIDSRPLEGAGRVEDTLNLLGGGGHAPFLEEPRLRPRVAKPVQAGGRWSARSRVSAAPGMARAARQGKASSAEDLLSGAPTHAMADERL